jgi:hypothetical protein
MFVAALDDKAPATHAGILNVATKVGAGDRQALA